jgi:serine/threonine protein kinase
LVIHLEKTSGVNAPWEFERRILREQPVQFKLLGTPENYPFNMKNIPLPQYKGNFDTHFKFLNRKSRQLLKSMLDVNPNNRITIAGVLNSRYLKSFVTDKQKEARKNYINYLKSYKHDYKYQSSKISKIFNQVTYSMRTIMIKWLMDIRFTNGFTDITYFRVLYIFDKFLIKHKYSNMDDIDASNLQLVLLTCFWIATKLETPVYEDDLLHLVNYNFSIHDMIDMEKPS